MATVEIGELIPSDVYHNINESLELKCLLDAHVEKLKEVSIQFFIFIHFILYIYLYSVWPFHLLYTFFSFRWCCCWCSALFKWVLKSIPDSNINWKLAFCTHLIPYYFFVAVPHAVQKKRAQEKHEHKAEVHSFERKKKNNHFETKRWTWDDEWSTSFLF